MTKTAIFSLGLAKLTKGTEVTVNTLLERPTYSEGVADTIKQIAASQNQDAEQLKYIYKFYWNSGNLLTDECCGVILVNNYH